ncbi:permease for cytosine/purines, uracil, thiamine, allantoin [bacterium BMS3Bbin01]|nr:permease for cytosine/purines, uracil, thiamine, allantoin [bacterium BMS3Bbin01]
MSAVDLTSMWVAITLGVPVAVVGFELMVSPALGGLGLSAAQLLLALPLGVVVAVGLLWASARPGAAYGEGTVLMLKPALGVFGSWIYFPVHVVLMVVLAALELRVVGVVLDAGFTGLGFPIGVNVGIILSAVLAFGLGAAGRPWLRWWVRRVAFWGGLGSALWVVWRLAADVDITGIRLQSPSPSFWLGVDMIVGLAVLFFPLVVDTARSMRDESAASASVGAGFGVAALLILMAGGLAAAAAPGVVDPGLIIVKFGGPALGVVGGLVLLAWTIGSEVDQPALFLVMPTQALRSFDVRISRSLGVTLGPLVAALVAMFTDTRDLFGVISFLISVLTPILAVFLADYFVVRRRAYLSRDLYRTRGAYRGVNVAAVPAIVLGFLAFQWASPVGAHWWVDGVLSVLPGAPLAQFGIPAVATSFLAAFLTYVALGHFTVRQAAYVSKMRI